MLTIIRRSWRSLTADPTRLSIALAFAFIGLLFWARLIVIADMPRTAVTDPERSAAPASTERTNDAIDAVPVAPEADDAADSDDADEAAPR